MRIRASIMHESQLRAEWIVGTVKFAGFIICSIVVKNQIEVCVECRCGVVFRYISTFDIQVTAILEVIDELALICCKYRPGWGKASTHAVTTQRGNN